MTGPVIDDSRSPVLRVVGILVGVAVALALVVGLVLVVLTSEEDEGSSDEAASVEADDADDEGGDEDPFDDVPDDVSDEVEAEPDEDDGPGPDRDGDGIPDAADPDDDDDGVPDAEDPDDDGDGVPDDEDDGPGGDDDPDGPGDGGEVDLLRDDPRPAVDAWIEAAGDGAKAVEVLLYTDYGFADVVDRPDVLRFGWRGGVVEGPERNEPFPGTDLEAESFGLNRPNWDALPGLVAGAPRRAGIPGGTVSHVIVTSDQPFSARFLFRIYVVGDDASDYVVATIDGQPAQR